jgi:rhamnosyltransferase subunit B
MASQGPHVAEALNLLLVAIGSHGDVHPFIGIGQAMGARGHRVRMIANPFFSSVINEAGLSVLPVGSEKEHREIHTNPDLWTSAHGWEATLDVAARYLRPVYRAIASAHEPGKTVVVYSSVAVGARVAQVKFGIPSATVHLSPILFGAESAPLSIAGIQLPAWAPRGVKRIARRISVARSAAIMSEPLRAVLQEAGVSADLPDWQWESPDRMIGLFPGWFAAPAPDWPPQTRLTGFLTFDQRGAVGLDRELVRFLDAGDPPIAFTPGSGMWNGAKFFAESVLLCAQVGRRGLLLSQYEGHIPRDLPPGIRHVKYAPFSALFPRCAAVVHHGGIGTSAQGMAAGIGQLITPFAHDQFDNARRLIGLGIARSIPGSRYRAGSATPLLSQLLKSEDVRKACRTVAARFPDPDAMDETCRLIEELLPS